MSDIEDSDNEGSTKYDSEKDEPEVLPVFNKPTLVVDSDQDDSDDDLVGDDEDDEIFKAKNDITDKPANSSNYNLSNNEDYDNISPINSDVDSDDEEYLQKFDDKQKTSYIQEIHPECIIDNIHTVELYTKISRNDKGDIIDKHHKTIPFLTKYEKTRILGQRAQQINNGSEPFVDVPENIIDGYLVAELELNEKKIPFIIRRPMPDNTFEYWKISDLELI